MRKRKIHVTTECVCDLPKQFLDHYGIGTMYSYVETERGRFCDTSEITSDNLLEYMASGDVTAKSLTASVEEFETFFSDALSFGEQVIHLTPAHRLGTGYKNALAAAQGFGNVTVMESGHISTGMGLLALRAAHLAKNGAAVKEILEDLERTKTKISTTFIIPSAEAMYKNGHISYNLKRLCEVFNLHLILKVNKSKIVVAGIKSGNINHAYAEYIRGRLKGKKNIDTRLLFITYSGCSAKQLKMFKEEVMKYQKFDRIEFQKASATISSTCGLGAMGLLYMKKTE